MESMDLYKWLREHIEEIEILPEHLNTDFQSQHTEELLKWVDEHVKTEER